MKSVKPLFLLLSIALLFSSCPNPTGNNPIEQEKTPLIAAGSHHSFVFHGKNLKASGKTDSGQLGLGNTTDTTTFIELPSPPWSSKPVNAIAAGDYHSLVAADGKVYATGLNDSGQLGLGDYTSRNTFTEIPLPPWDSKPVNAIAAGDSFSLVLAGGKVYATGRNDYGQLGLGNTTDKNSFTEKLSPPWGSKPVSSIAAGNYHSLVVADGKVYATGLNFYGQLGLGDDTNRVLFTEITLPPWGSKPVSAIAAGDSFSLVVADGKVYAAGWNGSGQLGLGDNTNRVSFTEIPSPPWGSKPASAIAAGAGHSLVATGDKIYAAGQNSSGELGLGHTTDQTAFTLVNTQ